MQCKMQTAVNERKSVWRTVLCNVEVNADTNVIVITVSHAATARPVLVGGLV